MPDSDPTGPPPLPRRAAYDDETMLQRAAQRMNRAAERKSGPPRYRVMVTMEDQDDPLEVVLVGAMVITATTRGDLVGDYDADILDYSSLPRWRQRADGQWLSGQPRHHTTTTAWPAAYYGVWELMVQLLTQAGLIRDADQEG